MASMFIDTLNSKKPTQRAEFKVSHTLPFTHKPTETSITQYRSNTSNFFSENVTAITIKFTWMIHISFAIMRIFFLKVSIIFNTLANVEQDAVY
jgi:hypothetical protein